MSLTPRQPYYEEGDFEVTATLTTVIGFSPMERDTPLTTRDAIGNAEGTVGPGVWEALESEGWNIRFEARRID